jgi:hypothetical protein
MGWLHMTHSMRHKRRDISRPLFASARVSSREAGRRTRGGKSCARGRRRRRVRRVQARVSERDSEM